MSLINLKVMKLHQDAKLPTQAYYGDAGWDLYTHSYTFSLKKDENIATYHTGLAIEIPRGYVGLIYPRSSISKTTAHLANSVGVIDSGYRGELLVKFRYTGTPPYEVGDKIAQLVLVAYPMVILQEVDFLSASERGDKGFGSSSN